MRKLRARVVGGILRLLFNFLPGGTSGTVILPAPPPQAFFNVTGTVTDDLGIPITGAIVKGSWGGMVGTDVAGNFLFPQVPQPQLGATYTVSVLASLPDISGRRYPATAARAGVGPSTATMALTIYRPAVLLGRVVDPDERGMAGAMVQAAGLTTSSNVDGGFEIRGCPGSIGTVRLTYKVTGTVRHTSLLTAPVRWSREG